MSATGKCPNRNDSPEKYQDASATDMRDLQRKTEDASRGLPLPWVGDDPVGRPTDFIGGFRFILKNYIRKLSRADIFPRSVAILSIERAV
jgi:hypothetical protein